MKRIHFFAVAAIIVGAVAYAAPDVAPWVSNYQSIRHKTIQKFDVEAQLVFIDAGVTKSDLVDAGNINVAGRTWSTLVDAGAGYVANNLGVGGTVYSVTSKPESLDAGAANIQGILGLNRPTRCGGASACGTVTLSSASPSTGTATVEAGSTCACWPVGGSAAIAAGGCAAAVSSTTLTLTGPNTVTTVMRYMCWL